MQPQQACGVFGINEQGDTAKGDQPKTDRDAAKKNDLGDLLQAQAPAGIVTVPKGTTAEACKADIVPYREADEGGQRDLAIGQDLAERQDGKKIEEGEA